MGGDRFLHQLPVEPSADLALRWIASLARHVATVCEAPPPTAFSAVDLAAPDGFAEALKALSNADALPELLGLAWEQLLASASRRTQGAHFTPSHVADRVVELALNDHENIGSAPSTVWDPASGGGAFLLAACRTLETRTNQARADIVRAMFATDIDPTTLMVCDAALEIWAQGASRPHTVAANSLLDLPGDWPEDFSMIVGNPPFLGQLTADTARGRDEQVQLKERYGDVATAYVDHSSLFVELALRHLGDHSALALILPQSFLGARDSEPVRRSVLQSAVLSTLWIDDADSFAASVEVIAIVALSTWGSPDRSTPRATKVLVGNESRGQFPTPEAGSWAPLLAHGQGVPQVSIASSDIKLSDIANVTAGFRQHFYGISGAVGEVDEVGGGQCRTALLLTSGSIDPLAPSWGHRPVKFAGTRWDRPVLHLDRIEDADVRRWFEDRLVPKVLVASQTPVIEAIVDTDGNMAPSVPVITIEPHDPAMIWHVAAALSAPSTSALMLAEAAGTGLSATAIRVRAKTLSTILLPTPGAFWDGGAEAARSAQAGWREGDSGAHASSLAQLGQAMTAAYGASPDLVQWWNDRLPSRKPPPRA